MKKNEILTDLFKSEEFDKLIKRLMRTDVYFFDDFKQDLFLILSKVENDRIEEMYENCTLDFFIVRIILNQVRSKTSPFYKTYKKNRVKNNYFEFDEETYLYEYEYKEFDVLKYCAENDILTWYETEILSAYYRLGRFKPEDKTSFRKLEDEYGIDHVSLYQTVNEAKDKIIEHLEKQGTMTKSEFMSLSVGDEVVITEQHHGHEFEIGQIVKIAEINGLQLEALCVGDDDWWYVYSDEMAHLKTNDKI